jgi:hypothetical protein
MLMSPSIAKQREIDARIRGLAKRLSPDVVDIKYTISQDWSGDPGIFFRVLISDDAGSKRLYEVSAKVERKVSEILDRLDVRDFPYFDYRSVSEQAALRDEAWV